MIFLIIIVITALCCSAFFALSETAVFSIPREKAEFLKNENKSGFKIYQVLAKSDLFLIVILLGNNFVNIIIISGLEKVLGVFLCDNLMMIFVVTTLILLVFGEITPKTIAVSNSIPIARFVAPVYVFVLNYFGGFLKKINSFNLQLLRMNYRYLLQTPDPFVTSEEYAIAVKEAVYNKKLSGSEGKMITSFIDLTEDSISKIARNRNSLKIINAGEKAELSEDEIGLCYENDEIKSVFYRSFGAMTKDIDQIWFPNTKTIGDLHDYFLKENIPCVLLLDEYGGFDGAVSKYDIYKHWKNYYGDHKNNFGEIIVSGKDAVIEYRDWIPQNMLDKYPELKTLNGILCAKFGDIPKTGQFLDENDFVFHIIDADKTKINKIKIQKVL